MSDTVKASMAENLKASTNDIPILDRPRVRFFPKHTMTCLAGLVLALYLLFLRRSSGDVQTWKPSSTASCPGYEAFNVEKTHSSLTADLKLAGAACDLYGRDIHHLKLLVEYQTDKRLHIKIYDAKRQVYQIQESVLPSPGNKKTSSSDSAVHFHLLKSPFSFAVTRAGSGQVLFNTSKQHLIFEDQYVRLRTELPQDPNLYGLGEHTDRFRLETTNYYRTIWNADTGSVPPRMNLYSNHPTYFEHRPGSGTHAVFLRNSNGMDVNIHSTPEDGQYLEYNTIGGVLDFYFLAGPTPAEVSRQYAETIGLADMVPYWSLGIHQCKYGYKDVQELTDVVGNSSAAKIPLDVLWSDIDSMDGRRDFTLDPVNYPMDKMRGLITRLHNSGQRFITMLDSGVARASGYGPYRNGDLKDVFLKADDGSNHLGRQWPGTVVWPDWFAPNTQAWWTDEILGWFDSENGMDVDGMWNDMNEASSFCGNIDCVPELEGQNNQTGKRVGLYTEELQMHARSSGGVAGDMKGLPDRDLFYPAYRIKNHLGDISAGTIFTNITNYDGTRQYDTHNMYGGMMAMATRNALQIRRPNVRPFVLTRSSFAGVGHKVAHWFGDNGSTWRHYRASITNMLAATTMQNMPMVGSDVCGFQSAAQEHMCARWALMAALQPFFRNHADFDTPNQEFYLWPLVADVARKAIRTRYRLLDVMYTALRRQTLVDGEPIVRPLFYAYPDDAAVVGIETQWLLGANAELLVSPVVEDDSKSVTFYLPDDVFYDFWTLKEVRGKGHEVTRDDVDWDDMPLHIRGGSVLPLRATGTANTTVQLRKENFQVVIAPGLDGGAASGSLYLDDGESVDPGSKTTVVLFSWDGREFSAKAEGGHWGFETELKVDEVAILGQKEGLKIPGSSFDEETGVVTVKGPWGLDKAFGFKF